MFGTPQLAAELNQAMYQHGDMKVYCLNDAGNLVECTGTKVQIMRDELEVPIFILERE